MPRPAKATCESTHGVDDQIVPSTEPRARPQAIDIRFAVPFLAKPYRITVQAEPGRRSARSARRDSDRRPLVDTAGLAMKFSVGFVLGGSSWIGLETFAVKLLQSIAV